MNARRRPIRPALFLAGALLLLVSSSPARSAPSRAGQPLHVFAAASLADAFGEIARDFERTHPGVAVRLNLAGSQQLALQMEHGAGADVFASADDRWMAYVRERSLVRGEPCTFARNRLVVIVPRTNPARIGSLTDLARRGVKVVLGADAVPVGRYGREAIANLGRAQGFPADFAARVLANVVSEEENVKSVVGKVQLGEVDAGMVYHSDVTSALARYVRTFDIPDSSNVLASYPIAVAAGSRFPEAARDFVALVLSERGQAILRGRGLLPIPASSSCAPPAE